jgi:hypothetical protein
MKSFLQFLSEASASTAVQQAQRMGLEGDGHGGWYKDGEFVAKTEKGRLIFYNKRQKAGQKDPAQTEKEKRLSQPSQKPADQQEPKADQPVEMVPPEVEKTKGTLTIAFGRFNPPTTGHEKLLDTVSTSSDDGDYVIVPSRSQDPKKNPLDPDTKVSIMRQMYPKHSEKIINDPANRTIFDVLKKAHNDGYTNVRIIGGGDRVKEFENLSGNYNGKLYAFDNIEVRSAGERDPDAEDDVSGMSASRQRKAAAEGDFKTFAKGVPSTMNQKQARELFNTLRSSMNIKEGWNLWEIAPKFDWKNLRENYIQEKVFRIGEHVENLNTGLIGKIIRRGTNHLICVTEDGIMFKSWIKDLMEYSEKHMSRMYREPGKPNTLVGTDGYVKYTAKQTKGYDLGKENLAYGQKNFGLNFINKYRKK